ncbi:MAG TPA: DUF1697 domain-containing protein [Isosphaeraceae bacterium]
MPATHLALLRGINVGGKNKLPMKDLAALFVTAGCKDVRTYIQSGNVVFQAPAKVAARLSVLIAEGITGQFGYKAPVVLRTVEQLRDVVAHNPFLEAGVAEDKLYVLFLADEPSPERVAALDPNRSPPDAFIVRGREIFLHLPGGVADSKLTNAYFDSKLATVCTGRNWRTVTTLLGVMEG